MIPTYLAGMKGEGDSCTIWLGWMERVIPPYLAGMDGEGDLFLFGRDGGRV